MAKKTSPGRGQKQCPKCEQIVAARAPICTNCNYRFRKKKKSARMKGRRSASSEGSSMLSNDQIATVLGAQDLIEKCGGAKAAIELIRTVSEAE